MPAAASTSRVPSGSRAMPWKRSFSTEAASAASFTTSAPPSMVVMFLLGWKLNETRSPGAPTGLPPAREPMASAASSRMRTPWRARKAPSAAGSSGAFECTGSRTRVRAVTAAAAASRSTLRVAGSTSTKTARAPTRSITFALAKKLCAGVTTSSPGPTPRSSRATSMAPVAEVRVRTGRPPT